MKPTAVAALAALLIAGCAIPPTPSGAVKPATLDQVAGCQYLDDLSGTSGLYGAFASQGAANARADLLNQAEAAGATHVVWTGQVPGHGSTGVAAKAYRCAH